MSTRRFFPAAVASGNPSSIPGAFARHGSNRDCRSTAWLDADAVVELSGRDQNEGWTTAFWTMVEKAEPYGYADLSARRVKAHVA